MTILLHHDFETRSDRPLKKTGVHCYAESPHTGVWVWSWALVDAATRLLVARGRWRPGEMFPLEVFVHLEEGGLTVNHNAQFERTIWNRVLRRDNPEVPELKVEQQDCTMARAAALGLPLSLGALASAMRTRIPKDDEGHRLMLTLCKPRGFDAAGTPLWHTDPDKIARNEAYCDTDVDAETHVDHGLFPLSDRERAVWRLDQTINDRGVTCDLALVEKAIDVAKEANARADYRMSWLTDAEVQKCTQTKKLVAWIAARGIPCESVAKGEIEEIVVGAQIMGDKVAEEAILLRRAAAKSSVSKYKAMKESVCKDGRLRGMLQYHGAHTGRWAGRTVQPQNFPRVGDDDEPVVTMALDMLSTTKTRHEIVDTLELLIPDPQEEKRGFAIPKTLNALSKSLRAMLIAAPRKKLVGGDFSNVEGRVNAWLAGEHRKLDAFRAYDTILPGEFDEKGEPLRAGPDLYKITAADINGVSIAAVTKAMRQATGKVPELALGFQGGVGAFIGMAANYGTKPWEVAAVARTVATAEQWAAVQEKYDGSASYGLDMDTWTGIKFVVERWRASNPAIVQGWWDLQDAAIEAVDKPGVAVEAYAGRVRYKATSGFLFCALPSKRLIAYPYPKLRQTERNGRKRHVVEYEGVDPKTKKWSKQTLYGGEQCNHIVQGTARDLMVEAMLGAEFEDEIPLILTVHDELLGEVDEDDLTAEERLRRRMSKLPSWAEGLPLAAATWEDTRYVK